MTLPEFNEMSLTEKHKFLFSERTIEIGFNSLREDDYYKYSLWDCGDFYIELVASKAVKGAVVRFEAISLTEERINLYIEFLKEYGDTEYPFKYYLEYYLQY